jgi:hypothetical protein
VCDASTVDFAKDTVASDFVDSWGYSENVQVHYNKGQRWYYISNQMPNELLVFKSADSEEGQASVFPGKQLDRLIRSLTANFITGAPHGSFNNPDKTDKDLPRQSLELRLLVTY